MPELLSARPCACLLQRGEGKVGADHRAACLLRKVESRPTPTGADVEQRRRRRQREVAEQLVGLDERRVTVRAPLRTDDALLDERRGAVAADAVALLEVGASGALIT